MKNHQLEPVAQTCNNNNNNNKVTPKEQKITIFEFKCVASSQKFKLHS